MPLRRFRVKFADGTTEIVRSETRPCSPIERPNGAKRDATVVRVTPAVPKAT